MDREMIVSLYYSGLSASEIGRLACRTKQTICHHLKRAGVEVRRARKLSNTDEAKIVECYLRGDSQRKLANIYNIDISVIGKTLTEHKVMRRNVLESVNYSLVNLPMVHSPQFYHYIGWMLTDGWIYKRGTGNTTAGLGSKDYVVIEYFRDLLSPNRRIYEDKGNFYRLLMPILPVDEQLLFNWGCVQRKSLILKPTIELLNLSDEGFYQLLVGLIEGDGSVFRGKKGVRCGKLCIYYYGTKAMCDYIIGRVGSGNISKDGNIYRICWSFNKAEKLAARLMNSKVVVLKRKWDSI